MGESPPKTPPSKADRADTLRKDVDDGLQFVHRMSMQMKSDLYDTVSRLEALVQTLSEQGLVNADILDQRHDHARETEYKRVKEHALVRIAEAGDKYAVEPMEEIDCASRLHLCHARCCLYDVKLSIQDLDEGILKWDYANPYVLPHDEEGYCVYSCKGEGGGCAEYVHRPSICRTYDCRLDPNIWIDFDGKVAVPMNAKSASKIKKEPHPPSEGSEQEG